MRQMIVQELFTCNQCLKAEVREHIIEREWVTIKVSEYVTKDFCCKECRDAFKEENHTLQEEQEVCHGL